MPNVSLCVNENDVHYNPYVPPYAGFCKLTLNNGSIVELKGSGELTSTMTSSYKSTLVSAEIGTQCTSIGSAVFVGCTNLTSIDIPNNVTSIGGGVFYNCSGLTSVTIPDSVTSIGSDAFSGCSSLTSVTIGSGVTSIGSNAFSSTNALKVLNYNAKCELSTSFKSNWPNLETVIIGDSTPTIGYEVFQGCSGLTSCTIGNGVTSIGSNAFTNCSGLTSIDIPNNVTSIGSQAFSSCSSLTSVTIGNSVTSIGSQAFSSCSSLSTITSHIMNAPSVNPGTFASVSNGGTLYVPIGSSGYDTWMNDQGNLGMYNWTKVEQ